jgi:hypothetical protein
LRDTSDGTRNIVFIVWSATREYLPAIEARYPEEIEEPSYHGRPGDAEPLLISFRVKRQSRHAG